MAAVLCDRLSDGISLVYSFYEPDLDEAEPRELHHHGAGRLRKVPRSSLCLPWLLDRRVAKNGLQDKVHPPRASHADGLGPPGSLTSETPRPSVRTSPLTRILRLARRSSLMFRICRRGMCQYVAAGMSQAHTLLCPSSGNQRLTPLMGMNMGHGRRWPGRLSQRTDRSCHGRL